MALQLQYVAFLVREYDEAIDYLVNVLGFELVEDSPRLGGKRWVRVASPGAETGILLSCATTPEQLAMVGNQAAGRVLFFVRTDNFDADYERLRSRGVQFVEEPRTEDYGRVAVFKDLYGNRWDLLG
jgi:catechol 2,3-dioxygenase-like lactoylglutathione lyase family enzyme